VKRGKLWAKKQRDKVRRYSEHIVEHIKNLDNNITWWNINANIWEQATNALGTHI
jgi:hypothetical protein